ncbi:MAG: hypothetical protein C0602_05970 [Denitrovibrio sp.]|nr:MAG: hypothetical protein C0602_05970 [Denitrovibrio sp.]
MVQYESKESLANLQQGQQYAVLIFHNTAGYPPHKQLIFETLDEVIQCIREQLAMVPLVSLEGKPPQFKTSDEYREYIEQYGMVEFFI